MWTFHHQQHSWLSKIRLYKLFSGPCWGVNTAQVWREVWLARDRCMFCIGCASTVILRDVFVNLGNMWWGYMVLPLCRSVSTLEIISSCLLPHSTIFFQFLPSPETPGSCFGSSLHLVKIKFQKGWNVYTWKRLLKFIRENKHFFMM